MKATTFQTPEEKSDQLMMEMFDAVFRNLCPDNDVAEEDLFHRTDPWIARHAVIGLTCLLLTYSVQHGEDMTEVFEDFVQELRSFFLADGPDDFVAH